MERSRTKTETVRTIVQHDNLYTFQQSVGKGGSGGSGGEVDKVDKVDKVEKWRRSGKLELELELEQKLDNTGIVCM